MGLLGGGAPAGEKARERGVIEEEEDEDTFEPDPDEDREEDPAPLFGCACENPLSVDTCCDNCIEWMKENEPMPTVPETDQIEAAFIETLDEDLAIAQKYLAAGDTGRAILHTHSAATQLGYLQGRARDMLAPHILAARARLNVGVLAVALGAAPPRTRKRRKEASA